MSIQDTLTAATDALAKEGIAFALIGGFALAAHDVVRATQDIDLLVHGDGRATASRALTEAGFEVVFENKEVSHWKGVGQLDVLWANREPTREMLTRAQKIRQFPLPVVAAEDLIGLKIQAYKNDPSREFQDKADIQSLLERGSTLDFQLIKRHADLFGEWAFIEELRKRI
jgi:hypothetical protein